MEISRELVEVKLGLEADRLLGKSPWQLRLAEGGGAIDDQLIAPAKALIAGRQQVADLVDDAGFRHRDHVVAPSPTAGGCLQGQGHAEVLLIAAADGGLGSRLEPVELAAKLLFIFVAVPGQPALAPDVGSLGDDRAVGVDPVFDPFQSGGQLIDAGVGGDRRLLAVGRLEGGGQFFQQRTELPRRHRRDSRKQAAEQGKLAGRADGVANRHGEGPASAAGSD